MIRESGCNKRRLASRPDFGSDGEIISLITNHFPLAFESKTIFHYDIDIEKVTGGDERWCNEEIGGGDVPITATKTKRLRKLSSKINRFVIEKLVGENAGRAQTFFGIIPVYDGQKNLYSIKPLRQIGTDYDRSARLFTGKRRRASAD